MPFTLSKNEEEGVLEFSCQRYGNSPGQRQPSPTSTWHVATSAFLPLQSEEMLQQKQQCLGNNPLKRKCWCTQVTQNISSLSERIASVQRTNFWAQRRKKNKVNPQDGWHFLATKSRQAWASPLTASKWKLLLSHLGNAVRRKWNAALHALCLLSMRTQHRANPSSCTCMAMSQNHSWPVLSYLAKWKKTTHHKGPEQSPSDQTMNHQ